MTVGIRQRLERASPVVFGLYAAAASFSTYFCMYGFRRPFAVAQYAGAQLGPLDLKDALVIGQVLGYTLSKFLAVRWVSELPRARRTPVLVGLVLAAQLALVGFALAPPGGKVIAIFLNGLPLGAVWGLVFSYLEGRRTSDFTGAALCCSFIVASGWTKALGQVFLGQGVSEDWMPALTGLCFLAPFLGGAWLLHQLPHPSRADELERTARPPMDRSMRSGFLRGQAMGMVPMLIMYFLLTALRDYRDNYAKEIWTEFGLGTDAWVYATTENYVALVVLAAMASVVFVRDNRRALIMIYCLMIGGMVCTAAATLAFNLGWLGGRAWMTLVGVGLYLAYVPYNCLLFDRLVALLRSVGTAVFAINLADAVGYSGSVSMVLYKQFAQDDMTRFQFFRWMCLIASSACILCFLWSLRCFLRASSENSSSQA